MHRQEVLSVLFLYVLQCFHGLFSSICLRLSFAVVLPLRCSNTSLQCQYFPLSLIFFFCCLCWFVRVHTWAYSRPLVYRHAESPSVKFRISSPSSARQLRGYACSLSLFFFFVELSYFSLIFVVITAETILPSYGLYSSSTLISW